jgi:hypothetical protein
MAWVKHTQDKSVNKKNTQKKEVSLLKDYGLYYHNWLGEKPLMMQINNPTVNIGKTEGYVHFETDGYLGTIIVSIEKAKLIKEANAFFEWVKCSPRDEFWSTDKKEKVLPFVIVQSVIKI